MERIRTANTATGALPHIVDGWFFSLENDVIDRHDVDENDDAIEEANSNLMEKRLAEETKTPPQFAATLRANHRAQRDGDFATAQGLLAWLGGQPNVDASWLS